MHAHPGRHYSIPLWPHIWMQVGEQKHCIATNSSLTFADGQDVVLVFLAGSINSIQRAGVNSFSIMTCGHTFWLRGTCMQETIFSEANVSVML